MALFSKTNKQKKAARPSGEARVVKPVPAATSSVRVKGHTPELLAQGIFPVKRAYMSEKAHRGAAYGAYTFLVAPSVNKAIVRRYVEQRYGVDVEHVNITRTPAKTKHFRGRAGHTGGKKKATVRLRKGQTVDLS